MPYENVHVPETAMFKEVKDAGNRQRGGYIH